MDKDTQLYYDKGEGIVWYLDPDDTQPKFYAWIEDATEEDINNMIPLPIAEEYKDERNRTNV